MERRRCRKRDIEERAVNRDSEEGGEVTVIIEI